MRRVNGPLRKGLTPLRCQQSCHRKDYSNPPTPTSSSENGEVDVRRAWNRLLLGFGKCCGFDNDGPQNRNSFTGSAQGYKVPKSGVRETQSSTCPETRQRVWTLIPLPEYAFSHPIVTNCWSADWHNAMRRPGICAHQRAAIQQHREDPYERSIAIHYKAGDLIARDMEQLRTAAPPENIISGSTGMLRRLPGPPRTLFPQPKCPSIDLTLTAS
jgi:hypothetical protein